MRLVNFAHVVIHNLHKSWLAFKIELSANNELSAVPSYLRPPFSLGGSALLLPFLSPVFVLEGLN